MDKSLRVERSRTFGGVADVYARTRPAYPDRCVSWLTGGRAVKVLELGAGTGKLTAQLVRAGHDVVATEPSEPMLAHLADRLGQGRRGVACVRSTAERPPFAAGSFDVVVVAQAYHWFDTAEALPQIARVLREGGLLSLVWNIRDDSIPWVRKLSDIIGSEDHDSGELTDQVSADGLFEPVAYEKFGFWQDLDEAALVGLVESRSYVAALEPDARAELIGRVRELYAGYDRGPDGLRMRYRTDCYRARVLEQPLAADEAGPLGGEVLFGFG